MAATRSLEQIVEMRRCVVRESDAQFGYVFELTPDGKGILRGRHYRGLCDDRQVVQSYFKPIGEHVIELLARDKDEAVPVVAPRDRGSEKWSWFAACLRNKKHLGAAAAVVIVYSFYDEDEAVRTLQLLRMATAVVPF